MKLNSEKFIAWLSRQQGKKLGADEILRWDQFDKGSRGKNAKPGPSRKKNVILPADLQQLLNDLDDFHLLSVTEQGYQIAKPFLVEATLSVARSGIAFGMGDFKRDIFIPPSARQGARHRDRVLLAINSSGRNRYEGSVVRIVQPFSNVFMARVSHVRPDGAIVTLIDLPDSPLGFIRTGRSLLRKVKEGANVVVESGTEKISLVVPSSDREKRPALTQLDVFRLRESCSPDDLKSDILRVTLKYNLPLEYPRQLVPGKRELKKLTEEGFKDPRRKNLARLYTCTIDGDDAKDFDDAISLEEVDGRQILYVHIADVSHYVTKDSPLEKEALSRGNSYYLLQRVIPMLPPLLSEDFCSLRPKTRRLAFTAEMHLDDSGEVKHFEFYKSAIFINKRFTYSEAEKELDKANSVLQPFLQLSEKMLKKRLAAGRLDLALREVKTVVDEKGRMIGMEERERLRSHRLIEEFMLTANIYAARFTRENKILSLYRVHEAIAGESLKKLNAFLELFGFSFRLQSLSQQEIQQALAAVSGSPVESIFNYTLLRSFMQAYYSPEAAGHWGLAFSDYTHFTSPIRRFSDLAVHRQMNAFLNRGPGYQAEELAVFADTTSRMERLAMEAERDIQKLMAIRYIRARIGSTFKAFLSGFKGQGLFVSLENPMLEGFIPVSSFSRQGEVTSLDEFRVILPRFQKTIPLGTPLSVRLVEASWEKMQIIFEIVSILPA